MQRGASGARKNTESHREDEFEHQTEEEHRRRIAQNGEHANAGILRTIAVLGGDASEADADEQCHDEREQRQFERGGAIPCEHRDHRLVVGEGTAEVAMQQAAQVIKVLHDERAVIAGPVNAALQFLGCESAAHRGRDRIAGGTHHEEHDRDENEHGGDNEQEATENEAEESCGKSVFMRGWFRWCGIRRRCYCLRHRISLE